ncbi:MAG: hypothetical protein HGB12_17945 [Bacteroidetes bacterium]|nr:hypothetical protein [Bacteroidota bacterium]
MKRKSIGILVLFFSILLTIIPFYAKTQITDLKIKNPDSSKIKSLYLDNRLIIISNRNDTLKQFQINASKSNYIASKQIGDYFFVAFSRYGSTECNFFCLIDLIKNKVIFDVLDTTTFYLNSPVLPNIEFVSVSPNKQYFLIEGGTSASIRLFKIYNVTGVVLKEANYMTACELKWNAISELEYCVLKYDQLNNKSGKKYTGMNNAFGQKYIWSIKNDIPVGDLFQTYIE